MNRRLLIVVALASMPATPIMAAAPQRVTVFTGSAAPEMLRQCSRGAPKAGTGWFRPSVAEISRLDRATVVELAKPGAPRDRAKIDGLASLRRGYAVEVVGIVRDGRRYVYGSYLPMMFQEGVKEAATHPTIVCDGGPTLFGVEIDARTGRVTHVAFNGHA